MWVLVDANTEGAAQLAAEEQCVRALIKAIADDADAVKVQPRTAASCESGLGLRRTGVLSALITSAQRGRGVVLQELAVSVVAELACANPHAQITIASLDGALPALSAAMKNAGEAVQGSSASARAHRIAISAVGAAVCVRAKQPNANRQNPHLRCRSNAQLSSASA